MAIYLAYELDSKRESKQFPQTEELHIGGSNPSWDLNGHAFASHFSIVKSGLAYQLRLHKGTALYQGEEISDSSPLKSGSHFTIDNMQFSFSIVHDEVKVAQRNGLLSTFSQVTLAIIILFELLLAIVLPRIFSSSDLFKQNITIEKSVALLDTLRKQTSTRTDFYKNASPATKSLTQEIKTELDKKAWLLRKQVETITPERLQEIHRELLDFKKIMAYIQTKNRLLQAPPIDSQKILKASLNED